MRSRIVLRKQSFSPREAVFHSNVHADVFHSVFARVGHVTMGRWSHMKVSAGRLDRRFSLMFDTPCTLVFYDNLLRPSGTVFAPAIPSYHVLIPRVLTKRKV